MATVMSHTKSFWWKVKVWIMCARNGHEPFNIVNRITMQPVKETYCKKCFKKVNNPSFNSCRKGR